MSTINFNLKNKNNQQIKNEVLSKMLKIKDKYDNDANYYDLFYNVVQNSTSKNNMKLSIQKDGNFTVIKLNERSVYTSDRRTDRVRVFVNGTTGLVYKIPVIG